MARNQIMFYATSADLGSVLSPLEAEKPLQYTRTGLFETNEPQTYFSYTNIPDFGRAPHPTAVANPCYLVSLQGTEIHVRAVPQKAGGVFFAIDQLWNDGSIAFSPGGRHRNNVILYGMVGTVSQSAASKALYNIVAKALRKNFLKTQEFFVGPEALHICKSGARLTIGVSSPPEFDLKCA
jgi:hypothetical protein